jgi:pimeloyl-ACP methyl ester carboxylesterase
MRVEWFPPREEAALRDEELRAVTVPALVVHGESDWLISARHADRYTAMLPSARRLDVPRGLHGEYLVTSHGDALVEAIRDFLDGGA